MANTLDAFRNGGVGFINGLDGLLCIINRFPLPRASDCGGDGASPIPGVNLNELLGSLSEFAALLPASILRMLLASPYQQDRLRPFFREFCQDFV